MTSLMFVLATGQAPVRAAASSVMETTSTAAIGSEVVLLLIVLLLITLLLITIITKVTASGSLRMSPMHAKTRSQRVRTSEE
eukprot:3943644-Amphidinium_carterae.1